MKNFKSFILSQQSICPLCLERHIETSYIKNIKESISFKISSLQICVPLKGCVNACKSCIARISGDSGLYKDLSDNVDFDEKYIRSLEKIKNEGCKNVVLTSDKGEPLQNKIFLQRFGNFNKSLGNWFNIEIQTTGVLLEGNISFLKNIGVKLISLSVFDIFDDNNNQDIIVVKDKLKFDLKKICKEIKSNGITLRLSINLINEYDKHSIKELFDKIDELNPDQVTMKNLWHTEEDNAINKWIKTNKASQNILSKISQYMNDNGGEKISEYKYNYNNRSIWMVDNCMLGNYLILRPDADLYRSWDSTNPINLGE